LATSIRRRALLAAGIALVALAPASSAQAEEVFTTQAAAAHATDSTWIPAPTPRAAVCIVDSGVDVNPDTANVVARLDVTGGDGSDVSTQKHGTLMAMIASAPYNGFGMVGAAPSINVVSVRAMRPDSGDTFSTADFTAGITACTQERGMYNIKVISLSLGGGWRDALDATNLAVVEDAVTAARHYGVSVVAAAGNNPGPVDWPAAFGPVFAIGAAAGDGARCSFAASGAEIDLWVPGCPQDITLPDGRPAWSSGSSEATAFAAAELAQLRGLRSDLSVDDAERVLVVNAGAGPAGPFLDVGRAFGAAGLATELMQGHALTPTAPPAQAAPVTDQRDVLPEADGAVTPEPAADRTGTPYRPTDAAASRAPLPRPKVRSIRVRHGLLQLILTQKPVDVRTDVQVYTQQHGGAFPMRARKVGIVGTTLRLHVSGTVRQVSITYRDPRKVRRQSPPLTLKP
jgi:hypothetical protein